MASISTIAGVAGSLANLNQYVQAVESYPLLNANEEAELARRLRRENDLDAAWRLIRSHLRYVVRIARGYAGYGLPQEDLIQEGNVGLMKAVKRFDPSYGVRLVGYAAFWIRAEIHEFIRRNCRIVKLGTTKAKRKLFYKLRSAKKRLEWLSRSEAEKLASDLQVKTDDVVDMETRLYLPDVPFDGAATDDEETPPAQYLQDDRFDPEGILEEAEYFDKSSAALMDALDTLDDRSRKIIVNRWLTEDKQKLTLAQLGRRYGISAERVRQIEAEAIAHIREFVLSRLDIDDGIATVPCLRDALV